MRKAWLVSASLLSVAFAPCEAAVKMGVAAKIENAAHAREALAEGILVSVPTVGAGYVIFEEGFAENYDHRVLMAASAALRAFIANEFGQLHQAYGHCRVYITSLIRPDDYRRSRGLASRESSFHGQTSGAMDFDIDHMAPECQRWAERRIELLRSLALFTGFVPPEPEKGRTHFHAAVDVDGYEQFAALAYSAEIGVLDNANLALLVSARAKAAIGESVSLPERSLLLAISSAGGTIRVPSTQFTREEASPVTSQSPPDEIKQTRPRKFYEASALLAAVRYTRWGSGASALLLTLFMQFGIVWPRRTTEPRRRLAETNGEKTAKPRARRPAIREVYSVTMPSGGLAW